MIYDLNLFTRVNRSATGRAFPGDLRAVARGYWHKSRAMGGYWSAGFRLSEEDLTAREIVGFYEDNLGCRLVENCMFRTSWEGLLWEFRLVRNGREYRRTLTPRWFHNKVKVVYSYPATEDDEQGNLAYDPGGNDAFQDDGQDFSEWETAAGDAAYTIAVTNSDGTEGWGFLGEAFTTANADDSVYVFTDVERNTAGWNGETSGKTPSTYEVSGVNAAPSRQNTEWSENTDSSDEYGEMNYLVTLGGATPEAAAGLRDRELAECGWPRSRKIGGGGTGRKGDPVTLEVAAGGWWATLNWRYRETSRMATATALITTLVGASEFVSAGRIEENEMRVKCDCDPIPKRLGDAIEDIIEQGDLSGNIWRGGVYAGRELVYEQAPTDFTYYERDDGVLLNLAREVAVAPLVEPGFLLFDEGAPGGGQPAGTSNVWDDARMAYVDEVKFVAPDVLEYHLAGEPPGVTTLVRQIQRGSRE